VPGCILLSDSPTEVDIHHPELAAFTPFPKTGKNSLDKKVPLGMHIIKCAADKNIDFFPSNEGILTSHASTRGRLRINSWIEPPKVEAFKPIPTPGAVVLRF
jgi:hypothetical protein